MNQLPEPSTYELEFTYMPWGILIQEVLALAKTLPPHHGTVLDLMCGPGYLLNKLHEQRPDLVVTGVDNDERYITHAAAQYPEITFHTADARTWSTTTKFDLILCTAGLHHIPYAEHESFIQHLAELLTENGACILADPYIAPYSTEQERQLNAAELGHEYLKTVIHNEAPREIVQAALDIMENDVLMDGEYKTYTNRIEKIVTSVFAHVDLHKTWPTAKSDYGDFYFVLTGKIRE